MSPSLLPDSLVGRRAELRIGPGVVHLLVQRIEHRTEPWPLERGLGLCVPSFIQRPQHTELTIVGVLTDAPPRVRCAPRHRTTMPAAMAAD